MSAALKKGMVTGLAAYQCREQRRDSASRAAHNRLRDECIDALMHDPARTVDTPSYPNESNMPAVKAVLYVYDARPQLLLETLLIVAQVARGEVDFYARQVLHLRANALIAAQGQQHAADHRDALVESERDDRPDEDRDEDARDNAIDWLSERQREERAFGEA